MDQRRRQILAEEAVGKEGAAHDGQRQAHQLPRAFEDQHDQHRADDQVGRGQEARPADQVGIEDPVVEAGEEAEPAKRPEPGAAGGGAGAQIGDEPEAEQQQEGDVHGPRDLAGQVAIGRGVELEGREGDRDAEGDLAGDPVAEARRQAFDRLFDGREDGWGGVGHAGS